MPSFDFLRDIAIGRATVFCNAKPLATPRIFADHQSMKFAIAVFALLLAISPARGQTTTASPADDPPAPAAMAPSYVAIGEQLRLRLALFRRTLNDLSLDAAIKQRANQILDASDDDLKELLAEVRSGRMPGYHRLMTVPDRLRAARASLLAVIGPDQGDLLQEKLRSLRGEAAIKSIGCISRLLISISPTGPSVPAKRFLPKPKRPSKNSRTWTFKAINTPGPALPWTNFSPGLTMRWPAF